MVNSKLLMLFDYATYYRSINKKVESEEKKN